MGVLCLSSPFSRVTFDSERKQEVNAEYIRTHIEGLQFNCEMLFGIGVGCVYEYV
jgi:hypothetical protein